MYAYGFGYGVLHILAPVYHDRGAGPPLCRRAHTIYHDQGRYAPPWQVTERETCKRCEDRWREATDQPPRPAFPGPVIRDVQRGRLYDADNELVTGRPMATEGRALAYANALIDTAWFQKRWPGVRLLAVKFTRRNSSSPLPAGARSRWAGTSATSAPCCTNWRTTSSTRRTGPCRSRPTARCFAGSSWSWCSTSWAPTRRRCCSRPSASTGSGSHRPCCSHCGRSAPPAGRRRSTRGGGPCRNRRPRHPPPPRPR